MGAEGAEFRVPTLSLKKKFPDFSLTKNNSSLTILPQVTMKAENKIKIIKQKVLGQLNST